MLSAAEVTAVLCVDQSERWRVGERNPAEHYLLRHPPVRDQAEYALDLIYNEFFTRQGLGERPRAEEYLRRFPEHAAEFQKQLELDRALLENRGRTSAPLSHPRALTRAEDGPTLGSPAQEPPLAEAPPSVELPEAFGRYRVQRKLGQGGMGSVYLAHDTQLDRPVALKVPRLELDQEVLIQRFFREARIAATFNHPNLCPVYDVGQIAGIHYLSMPFLTGEPMSAWLQRRGPLSPPEAARFAARIARALQVAHAAGVIHRDLKPSNVMVMATGEPVVMDFGLAWRPAAPDPRLTNSGIGVGTPAYSPPEQLRGLRNSLGPTCDVYSLGVMLFEMLTSRLPFATGMQAVVAQIANEDLPRLSWRGLKIHPRLEVICLKALAKDPQDRFASMEAFAAALEGFSPPPEGRPQDQPAVLHPVDARSVRRRRMLVLALAGLGVAALSALAWLGIVSRHSGLAAKRGADLLQPGTVWSGPFRWSPPMQGGGEVIVTITERDGDNFRGVYSTGAGQYEWHIRGVVQKDTISWEYTDVIREAFRTDAVGHAVVEGTYEADHWELVYRDHNSTAQLQLHVMP
jgi:hypothetical protein